MKKGRIYSEKRKKAILGIKIAFFSVLMIATFVAILFISCTEKEQPKAIIWKVSYVDTTIKLKDYIYSTSEGSCRCGYQAYHFDTEYLEIPTMYKDSSRAVSRFYELYSKSNLIYEAYPYCEVADWEDLNKKENGSLLTVRNHLADTWLICLQFGLVDSTGNYIN